MKSANVGTRLLCAVILMLSALGPARTVTADGQVRSYVISGGGGVSSGGGFQLTGTIGQHAVTVLQGGNFLVRGGFWLGAGPPPVPLNWLYLPVIVKSSHT